MSNFDQAPEYISWATGTMIGKYQIGRLLGRQPTNETFLAFDTVLKRSCVIRRLWVDLNQNAYSEELARKQFESEVNLLVRINAPGNPHIPEVLDYLANHQCLVMKYIDGTNLEQILHEQGSILSAVAIKYVHDICTTLVYMHNFVPEPIAHGNIKLSNIIIDHDERIWVIDIGHPVFTNEQKSASEDPIIADPGADIHDLALLLQTLLIGVANPQQAALPKSNTQINPEIGQLIRWAMSADRTSRPNAQEFLTELEAIGKLADQQADLQAPDGSTIASEQELYRWCISHWDIAAQWLYGSLPEQVERFWYKRFLATELRRYVKSNLDDQSQGLDAVLAYIDPQVYGTSLPLIVIDTGVVEFGNVEIGSVVERTINLVNQGQRYVRVQIQSPPWIQLNPDILSLPPSHQVNLSLNANVSQHSIGVELQAAINIYHNVRKESDEPLVSILSHAKVARKQRFRFRFTPIRIMYGMLFLGSAIAFLAWLVLDKVIDWLLIILVLLAILTLFAVIGGALLQWIRTATSVSQTLTRTRPEIKEQYYQQILQSIAAQRWDMAAEAVVWFEDVDPYYRNLHLLIRTYPDLVHAVGKHIALWQRAKERAQ